MAIQVVPLISEWDFNDDWDITSGVKKFVNASLRPDQTPQDLPAKGDAWNISFPTVLCKGVNYKYINDRDTCGQVYLCRYDNRSVDNAQNNANNNIDEDDIPHGLDISANFQSYSGTDVISESNMALWSWASDSKPASDILINKIEVNMNLNLYRTIKSEHLSDFLTKQMGYLGKINSTVFDGQQIGCALYMGATAEEKFNSQNKLYQITLKFSLKYMPDGIGGYVGWNYIYRPGTNKYDKPIFTSTGGLLYQEIDFKDLTTCFRPTVWFQPAQ